MTLIFLFAIDEEKRLVLADGAADGAAELVQVELLDGVGKVAFGIESRYCAKTRTESREIRWTRTLVVTSTVGPARVPYSAE